MTRRIYSSLTSFPGATRCGFQTVATIRSLDAICCSNGATGREIRVEWPLTLVARASFGSYLSRGRAVFCALFAAFVLFGGGTGK